MRSTKDQLVSDSPLVSMEIPLRTAYGQNGRCGMQPKAKHSLRAQAQLMRTETVETFELVKVKQKLLDIRAELERKKGERERCASRRYLLNIIVKLICKNLSTFLIIFCLMLK
ncbi:hypothetical protein TNCV_2932271 [Trichonephila clavipes]|nr:hypothetical protein TNCV_2932271 [Trichonephila clavipes]